MADRVLVEIVTAANMAGVKEAKAGFLGVSAATLGLTLALGALVMVGKDAIKNTEAQDKAHLSLVQAVKKGHNEIGYLTDAFAKWAEANKRYIPDQYAAETALAAFVRAGNSAKDSMRMLNDALDLSTLKGIDMATAQNQIEMAVMGNARALKALGIDTATVTKIMHSHLTAEQKHLAILHLIEAKTKDGRKAQTDLTQSTQAMNKDWQDVTTKIGPPLLGFLAGVIGKVDELVTALDSLGKNKDWNKNVSAFLGTIQDSIVQDVKFVEAVIHDIQTFANFLGQKSPTTNTSKPKGYASGGSVAAGQVFTVGEKGPETLVMGNSGGSVIPNGKGGGTVVHVHMYNAVMDGPGIDRLTMQIAQRLSATMGT